LYISAVYSVVTSTRVSKLYQVEWPNKVCSLIGYKLKATPYLTRRKRSYIRRLLVFCQPLLGLIVVTMFFAAVFALVCLLVSPTLPKPLISVSGLWMFVLLYIHCRDTMLSDSSNTVLYNLLICQTNIKWKKNNVGIKQNFKIICNEIFFKFVDL
jgi:hypothetical protein